MKSSKREVIGSFTVLTPGNEIEQIVISQDLTPIYSAETCHAKYFHLNSLEGLEVAKTEDPNIFMLPDGTRLRKTKSVNVAI